MHNVLVIVESGESNLSAFAPDLPGACISTGTTREELERNMYEALQFHIAGTLEDGLDIPEPSIALYLSLPLASADKTKPTMYRFLTLLREEQQGWAANCDELAAWDDTEGKIEVTGTSREEVEQKMYNALQEQASALLAAGEEIPQYDTTAVYMLVPEPTTKRLMESVAA